MANYGNVIREGTDDDGWSCFCSLGSDWRDLDATGCGQCGASRPAWRPRRPSEGAARAAIHRFLIEYKLVDDDEYELEVLCEDGDAESASNQCGWAFGILMEDTTSYVHEDLTIEWYGTSWEPEPNKGALRA